jgi:ribosomal protein L11 methyltransferase
MKWNQVSIETSEQACDIVASVLIDAGANGVQIEGGAVPRANRDEYLEPTVSSDSIKVIAYYGETGFADTLTQIKQRLSQLQNSSEIALGSLEMLIGEIEDTDWNANFKKNFTTFRAAGSIVIKPTWENYDAKPKDIVIEMDPGMAFGSGVHETTKMCLELVQKYKPKTDEWSAMDVGCGSGILGIACAKLGANSVLALDYDNVGVDVTIANAKANNVKITARQSDLLQNADKTQFDLVLANIIAEIIIRLNKNVGDYLKDDGVYIVSGIIDERLDEVLYSLKQHNFIVLETLSMADWRAVAVRNNHA